MTQTLEPNCIRCMEHRDHVFHDNGEPTGFFDRRQAPPVQLSLIEEPAVVWLNPEPNTKGDPRFHALLQQIGDLHDQKQQDYGTNADAFANVRASEEWGISPWIGAMIRATDKVRRLQTYATKGSLANEGVEDSLMDLAVYALISLVLFREEQTE